MPTPRLSMAQDNVHSRCMLLSLQRGNRTEGSPVRTSSKPRSLKVGSLSTTDPRPNTSSFPTVMVSRSRRPLRRRSRAYASSWSNFTRSPHRTLGKISMCLICDRMANLLAACLTAPKRWCLSPSHQRTQTLSTLSGWKLSA